MIGGILLVCLLVGTFYDYSLAQMIYQPQSIFGILFASYGQLPAMLCFSIAGILIIKMNRSKHKMAKVISYLGGGLLNILAILGIVMDPMLYIPHMSLPLSVMIAIFIVAICDVGIWKCSEGAQRKDIKTLVAILLGVILIEIIFINIVKIPWARPRMRLLVEHPEVIFQPWYVIGNQMKEHFMALGIAGEEFKSFPSGHSGNAACAMLIGLLPLICSKLKGKETLLLGLGFGFTCIVACSRMIMGAHFLSDVTIGITITFLVECSLVYLLIQKNKKIK